MDSMKMQAVSAYCFCCYPVVSCDCCTGSFACKKHIAVCVIEAFAKARFIFLQICVSTGSFTGACFYFI